MVRSLENASTRKTKALNIARSGSLGFACEGAGWDTSINLPVNCNLRELLVKEGLDFSVSVFLFWEQLKDNAWG
jgi:hypothetical protein